jgi:Rrf2 family protein
MYPDNVTKMVILEVKVMKLSTRSRYGTRLLLEAALSVDNRVSLGELTSKNQISRAYAERLIAPLITAGIIDSYRGFGGGICLSRSASLIKLSEVVKLLEGDDLVVKCLSLPETCTRSSSCLMRNIWRKVEDAIFSTLDSITIQELVDKFKAGDNQTTCPVSDGRQDVTEKA